MARQDYGDDLAYPVLQAGWKISDDGFGLHTLTATYKANSDVGFIFVRGEAFSVTGFTYMKLHKASSSFDHLGIQTYTGEYVGINPDINGGDYTNAQMTTAGGLSTEKIETIQNFTSENSGGYTVAGPPPYDQSPLGPLVSIKDIGEITSTAVTGGAVAITKKQSYIGENGACFENETGGKFLGFVDITEPYFYGKTSFLAAQQTFTGIIYVSTSVSANSFIQMLSKSSGNETWEGNLPPIIPDYLDGPWNSGGEEEYNQLLLTQANVESYGSLYKITYEVKYSIPGWHPAVYDTASAPA